MVFDDFSLAEICQKESEKETGRFSDSTTAGIKESGELMKNKDSDSETRRDKYKQAHRNHSPGDINDGRRTRGIQLNFREIVHFACFVSIIEPKHHKEALIDEFYILAMEEELEQNKVCELIPKPLEVNVVGTKWIFKNKIDEDGVVVRNKSTSYCSRLFTRRRNIF